MLSVFSALTRPSPRHVGHGSATTVPSPAHVGHEDTVRSWPNSDCTCRRTSPLPPQVPQVLAFVPGLAPLPPHVAQGSSVLRRTDFVVPVATSSSVRRRVTFRSGPRRCSRCVRSPPPNRASKPPRFPKSRMKTLSASERSKCEKPDAPPPLPRRPASP